MIRMHSPRLRNIRMADDLDSYNLLLSVAIGRQVEPLINKLRDRTLTRREYELLRSLLIENMLKEGQPDETRIALVVIQEHWTRCPSRYLPPWKLRPALNLKTLAP